ncbi:MAG: hypothetical protein AABX00_05685 [Nanoarchaeota archaeon]
MFWKKDNSTERKLAQMNEVLKKSFSNVKNDTQNIFQWLNYFHRKSMEQEQLIKQLKTELSYMPKTREDIRRIVDDYYSFESIMAKIRDLSYKVDQLAMVRSEQRPIVQQHSDEWKSYVNELQKRLENLEHRKSSIREKIVKKITRNSKEYVKSMMLSYIRKYERISALQLKDIVVDEQNFCSKSSFYRLLEELEELEEIGVIKEGKEKHYVSKAIKRV